MKKKGILLINLGTPNHYHSSSVRRYLKEFLNDPRVIDLPVMFRWPLVNLAIIPLRYRKTAAAYQKIWMNEGSPLLVLMRQLTHLLSLELGEDYQVEMGMRYGNPSIQASLEKLSALDSLSIIPLFPQYASAATGSAIEKTIKVLATQWNIPHISIRKDFYSHPDFIAALADSIHHAIRDQCIDLLLFSYHGLPQRHLQKSHCQFNCKADHACTIMTTSNAYCYRAQCYATAQLVAQKLNLTPDQYCVAFQSRLGRTPWIKPYTDLLLPQLIQQGKKHIAVVSPSFVVDCLETLEEINIRTRQQWHALGGRAFTFIPCLNTSPRWIKTLSALVKEK